MNSKSTLEEWNTNHDAYATLDQNPTGQNKVIIAKGNEYIAREIPKNIPLSKEILDEMYFEIIRRISRD